MIKKNIFRSLVAFPMLIAFSSCVYWYDGGTVGKGSIVEQEYIVSNFNTVENLSSAEVTVIKGDSLQVILSDYENLIEFWNVKVLNNRLIIQVDEFSSIVNSKAKLTVILPTDLKDVKVSGSGDVELNSAFPELENASISGSGSIKANVNAAYSKLQLTIFGSGSINFKGTADELKAITAGSGNMKLNSLVSTDAVCTISGSGDMYIHAVNSLKAVISGSGNVIYSGNPTLNVNSIGSGIVRHL